MAKSHNLELYNMNYIQNSKMFSYKNVVVVVICIERMFSALSASSTQRGGGSSRTNCRDAPAILS